MSCDCCPCCERAKKVVYIALLAIFATLLLSSFIPACAPYSSWVKPPVVLFFGLAFALSLGEAFPKFNKKCSKVLLQWSVVGLGFGMDVTKALQSGKEGMLFTIGSVVGTMALGLLLGLKLFKVDRNTSYLVSSGTAICGGSAIAAVGPVIRAKDSEMSIALATVFVLNAIALFIFPPIGHAVGLDQHEFGTWAAIAIHDTSSVVGAAQAYGDEALQVATTVKLTRALWIVPLALCTSLIFKGDGKKFKAPAFIFWFIAALLANTYLLSGDKDSLQIFGSFGTNAAAFLALLARKALTLTMFFIGASLTRDLLKKVGLKPLLLGVSLWALISVITLGYIFLTRTAA